MSTEDLDGGSNVFLFCGKRLIEVLGRIESGYCMARVGFCLEWRGGLRKGKERKDSNGKAFFFCLV